LSLSLDSAKNMGFMDIKRFTVGPFQEHTYLISDEVSRLGYIIDPGGWSDEILSYIKQNHIRIKEIIATHGHIDHIAGAAEVQRAVEAPFRMNLADEYLLQDLDRISEYFGFPKVEKPKVDASIEEGDKLTLEDQEIKVLHTPGHTPGSICLLIGDTLFSGDTLFKASIGRTDLPGGNTETILRSIKTKLLVLNQSTRVCCGHGLDTTISEEKASNPFLKEGDSPFF
jgi:hydroxyacylglutathione hydrolase